jgi:hypothetical protein
MVGGFFSATAQFTNIVFLMDADYIRDKNEEDERVQLEQIRD